MALTILQSPQDFNAAYTNLIYTVSGSDINQPQYQYVMDVISGSQRLARIRQYPNPKGVGVFDPHSIISDYIEYQDVNYTSLTNINQLTTESAVAYTQMQDFTIRFGEQYGTSPSSSVTLYDGYGNEGNTGVTASNDPLHIFPGVVDNSNPEQTSFDWNRGVQTYPPYEGRAFGENSYFTTQPYIERTSFFNDGNQIGIDFEDNAYIQFMHSGSANKVFSVFVDGFNAGGAFSFQESVLNLKPLANKLITIPISPYQIGATRTEWNNTVRIRVNVLFDGSLSYFYNIFKDPNNCDTNYNRVCFNFINELGAWDFYGFNLPTNETIDVSRETYDKPFVDYSTTRTSGNTVVYNPRQGGRTVYSTSQNKSISVTTPYLSQAVANHVEQIFTSPSVLLNTSGDSTLTAIPVIVKNTSFVRNTNVRGQKLFQYTFNLELSNGPIGR